MSAENAAQRVPMPVVMPPNAYERRDFKPSAMRPGSILATEKTNDCKVLLVNLTADEAPPLFGNNPSGQPLRPHFKQPLRRKFINRPMKGGVNPLDVLQGGGNKDKGKFGRQVTSTVKQEIAEDAEEAVEENLAEASGAG